MGIQSPAVTTDNCAINYGEAFARKTVRFWDTSILIWDILGEEKPKPAALLNLWGG